MRHRYLFPFIGLIAAATITLAGCGTTTAGAGKQPANSGAKPGKVVTLQLWESHSGGPVAKSLNHLVKQFDASHSNIDVTLYVTHATKKALAAVSSGNPPVFAEISHYIGKYLSAKALVPWESLTQGGSNQTFWPGVAQNSLDQGKTYRYPADVKVEELFYNKSLFQKAGITSAPKTWNELGSDLTKLKPLGVVPMGFKDSSAHILSAFISNGGSLYADQSHHKVQFDNMAGETTFSFFRGLYRNNEMIFSHGNQMRADFGAQKMAIVDGTSAGYQKILAATGKKFQVGAFPLPEGSTGHIGNIIQGLGFSLFSAKGKPEQQAAWTFVHWFNEPTQQAYWAMHSGFAPTTPAGANAIPQSWLKANEGEAASIQILKSKYAEPRPNQDAYSEVQSALDAGFYRAVTGKETVQAALKKLDTQANQYLSGHSAL